MKRWLLVGVGVALVVAVGATLALTGGVTANTASAVCLTDDLRPGG